MIVLLRQRYRLLLAFAGGALGVLAFSPYDFWVLGIVSLCSLLILLTDRTPKQAAAIGLFWGFGLFVIGTSWVFISIERFGGVPSFIAATLTGLLAFYLALYPMLFGWLLIRFFPKTTLTQQVIAAPLFWQLTEALRGSVMSGFPWLSFGYTQIDGPLTFMAPIFGVTIMTSILFAISGLFSLALLQKRPKPALSAVVLIFIPALFFTNSEWVEEQPDSALNIALVQGNTDQSIKWSITNRNAIIDRYLKMSAPYLNQADLIVWPETAIPDFEHNQQALLNQLVSLTSENNSAIILGIVDFSPETGAIYNSSIVIGDKKNSYAEGNNRYKKHHLVPFGETVPFPTLMTWIATFISFPMSTMTPGDNIQPPLTLANYKFIMAICYEIILGERMRKNFTSDTDFLITLSNDAWFGDSLGPWQHFQMARMRALELGRPLIRSTNNGITAVINHRGKIVAQLPQFTEGVLSLSVRPATGMTPYAKYGNYFYWFSLAILGLLATLFRQK